MYEMVRKLSCQVDFARHSFSDGGAFLFIALVVG